MRRACLAAAALAGACYHAPIAVPSGETRARWLAERSTTEAPAPTTGPTGTGACGVSEGELVRRAVARSEVARARRAEARALDAAAEVPDADPLELRLSSFQLDTACTEVGPVADRPKCDAASGGLVDQTDLALRYRPARPGSIDAERDAIHRDADLARAEARDGERMARAAVRRALAEARAAEALVALDDAEVAGARDTVAALRAALAKKAASDLDLARAEVALAGAEAEAARDKARRARWVGEALALAGYDGASTCNLSLSPFSAPEVTDDEAALEARALASHPTVDARWAVEQKAMAKGFGARREAWPWLDFIQLGLNRKSDSKTDEAEVVAGISIELPIFQWGGEAADAADAAALAEREATRAALDAVRDEVRAAARELEAARGLYATLTPPLDEARLAALRTSVAGGYGDATELGKLERRVRRLARQRVEASLAIERAAVRLEAAIGAPLEAPSPSDGGNGPQGPK